MRSQRDRADTRTHANTPQRQVSNSSTTNREDLGQDVECPRRLSQMLERGGRVLNQQSYHTSRRVHTDVQYKVLCFRFTRGRPTTPPDLDGKPPGSRPPCNRNRHASSMRIMSCRTSHRLLNRYGRSCSPASLFTQEDQADLGRVRKSRPRRARQ